MSNDKKINIAIVGASGVVGQEIVKLLANQQLDNYQLSLFASGKSAGKKVSFKNQQLVIKELTAKSTFTGLDIVFFAAGASISKEYIPKAIDQGAVVIDNSSAFRMDNQVPLVVPECNPEALRKHQGLIANPNCSTIQLIVAIKPLHTFNSLEKIIVATYQAVSGAGANAIIELEEQIAQYKETTPSPKVFPAPILGNIIPHVDIFLDNHYTKEEMKMVNETKKILNKTDIQISATCARVPVIRAHSEAVWLTFKDPMSTTKTLELWEKAAGIKVINEDKNAGYPMPLFASHQPYTYVGRLRQVIGDPYSICFWCVADQLLKGAALNAVQIAEKLMDMDLL